MNTAIPTQVGSRVGIGSRYSGVVATGDAIVTCVLPINIPTINGGGSAIGYFYFCRESIMSELAR